MDTHFTLVETLSRDKFAEYSDKAGLPKPNFSDEDLAKKISGDVYADPRYSSLLPRLYLLMFILLGTDTYFFIWTPRRHFPGTKLSSPIMHIISQRMGSCDQLLSMKIIYVEHPTKRMGLPSSHLSLAILLPYLSMTNIIIIYCTGSWQKGPFY